MDLGLTGRVAIVGGAGLEMGKHVAMALASEGAKVCLCARSEAGLRSAEIEVARVGTQHNVLAMPADLSEPRDIRRVVRDTFNRFGQIDILVVRMRQPNRGSLAYIEDSEMAEEVERHLLSAVRLTREVIPYMKQEHWGRIINLDLASVQQVVEGVPQANARQLYLIGYFKTLAQELAPFNITVNSLLTGPLDTEELKEYLEDKATQEEVELSDLPQRIVKRVPMRRLGKPREIGEMIAFLASEKAGYLTGTTISVDGGQSR
jgi:3-oxoacyl-[acyl-carrier protein] reductase